MTTMRPQNSYEQPDRVNALLAVLRSVCTEAHSLAIDIAALGEALSGVREPQSGSLRDLQSFDPLSQRALAMARLLHGIECLLSSQPADWRTRAEALIQAVPFYAERERLAAALNGRETVGVDSNVGNGDDLDWF